MVWSGKRESVASTWKKKNGVSSQGGLVQSQADLGREIPQSTVQGLDKFFFHISATKCLFQGFLQFFKGLDSLDGKHPLMGLDEPKGNHLERSFQVRSVMDGAFQEFSQPKRMI